MRSVVSQETVAQIASCTEDKQFLSQARRIYKNNQWLSCVPGTSERTSHSSLIAPSTCPARSPAPLLPALTLGATGSTSWHKQSVIVLIPQICFNVNENRNTPSYLFLCFRVLFTARVDEWLLFVVRLCVHVTLCFVPQVELHPLRWPLSQSVHGAEDSGLSHCGTGSERMHCDQWQFGHQHPRRE